MFNYTKDNWKRHGIVFGFLMFLANSALMFGTKEIAFTGRNLLAYFVIWIIGGLLYSYFAYRWQSRKSHDN